MLILFHTIVYLQLLLLMQLNCALLSKKMIVYSVC